MNTGSITIILCACLIILFSEGEGDALWIGGFCCVPTKRTGPVSACLVSPIVLSVRLANVTCPIHSPYCFRFVFSVCFLSLLHVCVCQSVFVSVVFRFFAGDIFIINIQHGSVHQPPPGSDIKRPFVCIYAPVQKCISMHNCWFGCRSYLRNKSDERGRPFAHFERRLFMCVQRIVLTWYVLAFRPVKLSNLLYECTS